MLFVSQSLYQQSLCYMLCFIQLDCPVLNFGQLSLASSHSIHAYDFDHWLLLSLPSTASHSFPSLDTPTT